MTNFAAIERQYAARTIFLAGEVDEDAPLTTTRRPRVNVVASDDPWTQAAIDQFYPDVAPF